MSEYIPVVNPTRIFYDEAGGDGGEGDGGTDGVTNGGEGTPPALPEGAFLAENFRDALPEDIRSHASLAKITSLEDLGRGYINGQSMIGKDLSRLVEIPGADQTEEVRGVLTKLGAPAAADGYQLEATEGAPEWLGVDQEMSKGFTAKAAELGLLPGQAQGLYSWFTGTLTEVSKTGEATTLATSETQARELEAEFGGAFDQNIAVINHAIDKLGGQPLRDAINEAGLGTNPILLKSYLAAGKLLAEDTAGDGSGAGSFGDRMSPDEARSKGKALLEQASMSDQPMERRRLNEEAQNFFKIANPGAQ